MAGHCGATCTGQPTDAGHADAMRADGREIGRSVSITFRRKPNQSRFGTHIEPSIVLLCSGGFGSVRMPRFPTASWNPAALFCMALLQQAKNCANVKLAPRKRHLRRVGFALGRMCPPNWVNQIEIGTSGLRKVP